MTTTLTLLGGTLFEGTYTVVPLLYMAPLTKNHSSLYFTPPPPLTKDLSSYIRPLSLKTTPLI